MIDDTFATASGCPEFEVLTDYIDARLEPGRHEQVRRHLENCPSCSHLQREIRRAVEAMQKGKAELAPLPEAVERRIIEMGRTWLREHLVAGKDVVFAHLASVQPLAMPAGVRGASGTTEFLYSSQSYDLRIQLRRKPEGAFRVRGYAYPVEDEGGRLQEVRFRADGGGPEVRADVDGSWGFHLADLEPGSYSVVVHTTFGCSHFPDFNTGG